MQWHPTRCEKEENDYIKNAYIDAFSTYGDVRHYIAQPQVNCLQTCSNDLWGSGPAPAHGIRAAPRSHKAQRVLPLASGRDHFAYRPSWRASASHVCTWQVWHQFVIVRGGCNPKICRRNKTLCEKLRRRYVTFGRLLLQNVLCKCSFFQSTGCKNLSIEVVACEHEWQCASNLIDPFFNLTTLGEYSFQDCISAMRESVENPPAPYRPLLRNHLKKSDTKIGPKKCQNTNVGHFFAYFWPASGSGAFFCPVEGRVVLWVKVKLALGAWPWNLCTRLTHQCAR